MKHFHSIAITFLLLLVASINISCEDDYRDMILFEGVEPLYSGGKCDNLIINSSLYLNEPEGIVVGIDGGDGNYSLSNVSASIATVEFTKETNGYQRISIRPKGEGIVQIVVNDGSGHHTTLRIAVKDRYKFFFLIEAIAYCFNQNLDGDFMNRVGVELTQQLTMKSQGSYVLIPADRNDVWLSGGELEVNPSAYKTEVLKGTYKALEGPDGKMQFQFSYNGEVHYFQLKDPLSLLSDTRTSPIAPQVLYEEVTSFSPVALPEGCKVYRAERWMYFTDDLYTNGDVQ